MRLRTRLRCEDLVGEVVAAEDEIANQDEQTCRRGDQADSERVARRVAEQEQSNGAIFALDGGA